MKPLDIELLALLEEGKTLKELSFTTGKSISHISRRLRKLEKEGYVV